MSPEQVSGQGSRERGLIDSPSDVFALGLVLFELAARRPAYALETLSLTEAVEVVAGARLPALRSVDHELPRELEWIVQRACAPERERRYPSVSELAADVEHLLADEPIGAAPPDTLYRLRSFVRRHELGVGAAALVLTSLALGLLVLARGLRTERRLLAAERAERRRAEGNAAFLSEMLTSVSPTRDGHDVRVLDVLDRAAPRIAERFADQPMLRAACWASRCAARDGSRRRSRSCAGPSRTSSGPGIPAIRARSSCA
jgi:serine/threonine-protein kinase